MTTMPDWVRQIRQNEDSLEQQKKLRAANEALAQKTIEADSPRFWMDFLKELDLTILSLDTIGLCASTHLLNLPAVERKPQAEAVQVRIAVDSIFADQRYLDIFYDGMGSNIRCAPNDGKEYRLRFIVDGGHLRVSNESPSSTGNLLDAAGAARSVIEPIVKRLKGL